MDFLNHREGGMVFYQVSSFLLYNVDYMNARNCKRLREFEAKEIDFCPVTFKNSASGHYSLIMSLVNLPPPKLRYDTPQKKVSHFPVPCWDYSRPGRVWFVTSRLGTGKLLAFF